MRRLRLLYLFLPSAIFLLMMGCSPLKGLKDDELILKRNVVRSVDDSVNVSEYIDYIQQKPQGSLFSRKRTILDTALVTVSMRNIQQMMENKGYLNADVDTAMYIRDRRATVAYVISPHHQYKVRNAWYDVADPHIDSLLRAGGLYEGDLSRGNAFSADRLKEEQLKFTSYLTNHGYRNFNKQMLTFDVDTSRQYHLADVALYIGLYRPNSQSASYLHPRFYINKVTYNGAGFLRENTLHTNTIFQPGELYSDKKVQDTYNRFARLQAVRSTNITFTEPANADSLLSDSASALIPLDVQVNLTKRKPHSIQVQPEGTNTSGDFGAALSVTYENRNVFHGSEVFSLSTRAAFEAIRGLEGYDTHNYFEFGVEGKLTFPTFIAPWISTDYQRRHNAKTEVVVSYNRQNRPEFHRRVFTGAWRYRWRNSAGNVSYLYDFLDLNYVSMPWISDTFRRDYLDNNTNRNAILKYNYEDLFIMKTGFGITYTDRFNSLKANVETAGNLLYGLASIFKFPKNDNGDYKAFRIAFAQYAKFDVDYTRLIALSEDFRLNPEKPSGPLSSLSLALHARVGVAVPYANSDMLPFEKRYFSGGANSVRGWSVRTLGPGSYSRKDGRIDFINQTGDMKIDLNAELRGNLFWKFEGAFFIDAGNVWTLRDYADQPGGKFKVTSLWKEMAVAYGVGLRMNFSYFVLRLDLGMKAVNPSYETNKEHFPLVHPRFSRDYALHFAVGMPF